MFAQIINKITGSEVTPFAVITDESTGVKYPLADYELLPKMAIVDADMMMNAPRGLTAASGIDAVTHALEAYASIMATDYTDGLALRSLKLIFENLPAAYEQGAKAPRARENMANAAKVSVKMGTFSQYDHPHTLSRYAEVADCLAIQTRRKNMQRLLLRR